MTGPGKRQHNPQHTRGTMAAKTNVYYLVKIGRLTGWLLLVFIAVYLVTGYAMCDRFGAKRLISVETAQIIHRDFDLPLVYTFAVHVVVSAYLAFKRWGWLKPRVRT